MVAEEIVIINLLYVTNVGRFKLTWTEGNSWHGCISAAQLGTEFEYKYAIQERATKNVKKWENCGNRKVSLVDIELFLDRAEVAPFVTEADEYSFDYRGVRMTYIKDKETLVVNDQWIG